MNSTGVQVTAGLGGFLAVFFLAIAVIFLMRDLSKRLRRLRHQEELRLEQERLEQERLDRGQREQGQREQGTDGAGQGVDDSAGG